MPMNAQVYARERLLRYISNTRSFHRLLAYQLANVFARTHPCPLIILGNQKSGTSAIAALLARALDQPLQLDIRHMRDLVASGMHAHNVVLERFIQQNRLEFRHPVLKEPGLTFLYDQLVTCFPRSPIVYVLRDPRANIRSILDRLGIPGTKTHLTPAEIVAVTPDKPVWRDMLQGEWLGAAGSNHIETLAMRWNVAADVYLHHTERMHLICYEDFVRDKTGMIAQIVQQLGCTMRNDISSHTNIQYQPRGSNKHRPWREFFGKDNLACIEHICRERMQQFGYRVDAAG